MEGSGQLLCSCLPHSAFHLHPLLSQSSSAPQALQKQPAVPRPSAASHQNPQDRPDPKGLGMLPTPPHTGLRVPRDSSGCVWDILQLNREIQDFFHEEGGFCVFHVTGPGGVLHSGADTPQLQRNLPHWNVMPHWLKRANKWTK